jgi:hypothetical protein
VITPSKKKGAEEKANDKGAKRSSFWRFLPTRVGGVALNGIRRHSRISFPAMWA